MNTNIELANILFPNIASGIAKKRQDWEAFFKPRDVSNGQEYTRVAPSPTGELHSGALYVAMINERIAHSTGGKFLVRIEDTDQLREVEGARDRIFDLYQKYEVAIDESLVHGGEYGPYVQSERKEIYESFIYNLLVQGNAYICFMKSEELETMREEQQAMKIRPGVYGKWAKSRDLGVDIVRQKIENGDEYVIRLKSTGNFENKIQFHDEMMGELELSENDEDFVLAKKDGMPTYHLAHLVDDYLMRITYVIRANEWVASITKHLELWNKLGVKPPRYGHIMPINKKDGDSVRKLSKRKDPEAGVQYFLDLGYPVKSLKSYLIRLAAPTFDEFWSAGNRDVNKFDLNLDELKRNSRGPIFDFTKLNSLSSDLIASMNADEVLTEVLNWTQKNDIELNKILRTDIEYSKSILNIERSDDVHATNTRKDIAKWSDVRENVFYFFEDLFDKEKLNVDLAEINNHRKEIFELISDDILFDPNTTLDNWVTLMKSKYENFKVTNTDVKFGEFMMFVRKLITLRSKTPNLYYIFRVLGKDKVLERVK